MYASAGTEDAMHNDVIIVREWDADLFHARVLELEHKGYIARRDSYRILADMSPEDGHIVHLHSIELSRPGPDQRDVA